MNIKLVVLICPAKTIGVVKLLLGDCPEFLDRSPSITFGEEYHFFYENPSLKVVGTIHKYVDEWKKKNLPFRCEIVYSIGNTETILSGEYVT